MLDHPLLWRGQRSRAIPVLATGHAPLDALLPGGGWPRGAVTEILAVRPGLGEFSLLLPVLAETTSTGCCAVLVDPPWVPYPPAMCGHGVDLRHLLLVRTGSADESLWASEQVLRGVRGGILLSWPPDGKDGFARLRRLQLAARANRQTAFLFRPVQAAGNASPASLRLHLQADERHLHVTLLKGRGARPGTTVRLPRQHPGLHARSARQPFENYFPGNAETREGDWVARTGMFEPALKAPDGPPARTHKAKRAEGNPEGVMDSGNGSEWVPGKAN